MSRPNFKLDLAKGQAAEQAFIKLAAKHDIKLTQTDGRKHDLIDQHGLKWEVKGDQYDHSATSNFFIEFYSDIDRGKLGGPAQALLNDCKYFVYFFALNGIAYVFDTKSLVEQLKSVDLGKPVQIQNSRWTTVGYKIARSKLKEEFIWKA